MTDQRYALMVRQYDYTPGGCIVEVSCWDGAIVPSGFSLSDALWQFREWRDLYGPADYWVVPLEVAP